MSARSAGLASVASSEVTAYTVSVDHFFPFVASVAGGPHDLDGFGGVRETQAGRDGGDLEGAPIDPAVATVVGVVTDRDLTPGQRRGSAPRGSAKSF